MYAKTSLSVLTSRCTFLAFLVTQVGMSGVNGVVDYCAENTFHSNTSWLQFTKEMSTKEYVLSGKFKSLHCCAKGYGSIEWFKDGKAYPWPGGVSNLILYPESANQTIYSQTLSQSDAGNYSCLVSNDTHQYLHTIQLHIIDATGYTGSPLPTYEPVDQYVRLGDEARLFCEAFVGRIDLPDAHNVVTWGRGDVNATLEHQRRFHETAELREDDQVLGSHLLIRGVRREDFGLYVCNISNTPFQVAEFNIWLRSTDDWSGGPLSARLAYKKVLFCLASALLAVLTVAALYLRFGLTLRRIVKDRFAKEEAGDGKEYDVLVCYSPSDAQFVVGVLVPTLESRYNYRCCSHQLPAHIAQWLPGLREQSNKSRRLLAVLSPSIVSDVWTSRSVGQAIDLLLNCHANVVCVTLQTLPRCDSVKNAHGQNLLQLSRRAGTLAWDPDQRLKGAFWAELRLRLPPQRRHPAAATSTTSDDGIKLRSTLANSSDSLEVLV